MGAVIGVLLISALCSSAAPDAAAQPYKDHQLIEVLKDFQRQGVKVIFSTALVTPDLRVGEEPRGEKPADVIAAMLAPHHLTVRVGLRGILLVVRAPSEVDPAAGGPAGARTRKTRRLSRPSPR
jgi:hypothetical protein